MMNFSVLKWFGSIIINLKKNTDLYQPRDLHLWYRSFINLFQTSQINCTLRYNAFVKVTYILKVCVQYIFRIRNKILMGICQMLLFWHFQCFEWQIFYIVWFVHEHWLVQPTVFDGSGHCIVCTILFILRYYSYWEHMHHSCTAGHTYFLVGYLGIFICPKDIGILTYLDV